MSHSVLLSLARLGVQASPLPVQFWGLGFFHLQAAGPGRFVRLSVAMQLLRWSGFRVGVSLGALVAWS